LKRKAKEQAHEQLKEEKRLKLETGKAKSKKKEESSQRQIVHVTEAARPEADRTKQFIKGSRRPTG